ncbi:MULTISPECIES: HNH endonuclease [Selenomonadaceae]|nr:MULTISPECIES: HNH endonuclease signature motif containing protein [Selenomonadaceae]
MPRKPKRPCRYQGCPKLTDSKSGYCEEHEKQMQRHYEHFARGYNQHERYGGAWKKIRDRYIAAHPLCERCLGLGFATVATLVHHVKPIADGGTNEESNLKSLCVSCHEKIHQRKKSDG